MRSPEQKFEAMAPPSDSSEKPEKPEEKKESPRSPEEPYIVIGEKSVSYLGVEVPKGEGGRLVPKSEEFKEEYFYLEGHHTTMREVATALLLNKPILLEGGTGVYNKTTTIARMCRDLNMNYCKVNFDRETAREDVIGGHTLKVDENGKEKLEWYDGDLLYAIRNGGVAFLDEYNRQSKLAGVINPIIDAILNGRKEITNPYNENERVRVHPNFRLVGAQNPPGFEEGHEYTDRSQLPAETFGRWLYRKLPIEYSEAEQNKLLAGVIGEKVDVQLPESEFRHIGEGLPVRELAEIPGMTHWRKNIVDIVRVLEAKSSGAKREMAKNQRQNLYFNPRLIMSTIPQYIARFYRGDINETVKNAFETCVIGMYSSETDKQKVRLMLDQASWKPQAAESKRKGPEREAKEQPKEKEEEKAETKEPIPETRLEGTVAEQIEIAVEKLGKENVFGPKEIEKTFGVRLSEIPEIPFSVEELERAEKIGQMLVLRVDKTKDGKPMSLLAMNDILAKRWEKEKKGGLLNTADGWRDAVTGEKDFAEVAPRSGWALVSKDLLPDSTSKNYIDQTEVIIKALREKAFKDIEMPEEYEKAIREFESNKDRLTRLMNENWEQAAKELSELKINQLTRQSIQETIYDLAMYYDARGKRLLPDRYTWSNSRSRRGGLVRLGLFDAKGVGGGGWRPDNRDGDVGVSLARRL
jgi:MoxR-like ATPase